MAIANPRTYLQDTVRRLMLHWPDNRAVNVVCHGHSVPAGYFATPMVDTFNAYPHLLHQALKEWFPFAVVNVIVTAIGGKDSARGAARFEQEVLGHRPFSTLRRVVPARPVRPGPFYHAHGRAALIFSPLVPASFFLTVSITTLIGRKPRSRGER